jgi:hypothetical protein
LAVLLFVGFDFLRLAGAVDGFDGFVRLLTVLISIFFDFLGPVCATEVLPRLALASTISFGVGRRSSSQSTS